MDQGITGVYCPTTITAYLVSCKLYAQNASYLLIIMLVVSSGMDDDDRSI